MAAQQVNVNISRMVMSFVCNKFGINPDIEINFRDLLIVQPGGCVQLDDNEYEVDIKRSLRLREMLTTLAHELVHAKQYELGQLTQNSDNDFDYWDKPSEIEALEEKQDCLSHGLSKIK